MELTLLVGDGAIMCHLADDVRITYGAEAIRSDHVAIEIHALVVVIVLRDSGEATRYQG